MPAPRCRSCSASATAPNDGAAGENDDIRDDVEALAGGSENDVLIGTAGPNRLIAYGGEDVRAPGPARTSSSGGTTAMSSTQGPAPIACRRARAIGRS